MNKYGTIYIICNTINDKVYIGQTTLDIESRFKQHIKKSTLKSRKYKLYNAMKKYGVEKFYIGKVESNIPIEDLDNKEIYYIKKYDSFENGYNSTKGGDGRVINKKYDEDTIIDLYKKGNSMTTIAKKYNVSTSTISRVLKKNAFSTRDNGNKYKQFDIAEFKKQWFGNVSISEMGKFFKCNEKTIKRYAKRLNLPPKNKNLVRDDKGRFKRKL